LVIILSIFIVLTILVFGILILIQNFIFFIFLVLDLRDEEKKKESLDYVVERESIS
jgi:hypothetical protein